MSEVHKIAEAQDVQSSQYEVKSFDIARDGEQDFAYGQWESEVKAFIDSVTLKGLFYSEDWVFICVDLLASAGGSVPLKVYSKEIVDGTESLKENKGHPIQKLLDNPNKYQDQASFKYNVMVEDCLMGNSIIWYNKVLNELTPIPTESVQITFDDDTGQIKSYDVYEANVMSGQVSHKAKWSFKPEEIIHIKRPNPSSLLWGLSPFIPGRKSVLFNRYSQDYLNSYYIKGAVPGLALTVDKEASEQAALRLLKSFEMNYTGRRNQRRTMILPKGVGIEQISNTIADQNLIALIESNMDKVLNILRVPKHALSLAKTGSLGSEEYKMAIRLMWQSAIIPMLNRIDGSFTKFFSKILGDNNVIKFDLSQIDALKDDELKKADLAAKQLSVMTINEVRQALYNLDPVSGGDIVISLQPKPQVFGQPQLSLNEPIVESIQPVEEPKTLITAEKPVSKYQPYLELDKKAQDDSLAGSAKTLHEASLSIFAKQAEYSVKEFAKTQKSEKGLDIKAAVKPVKASELKKQLKKEFKKLETDWEKDYVGTLSSTVDLGVNTSLTLITNEKDKALIETLAAKDKAGRAKTLSARGIKTFDSISDTSADKVIDVITKAVEDNKTVQQTAEAIAEQFKTEAYRAETIARTETLTALSIGQGALMDYTKEVIPDAKKVWIAAGDDRVRDSHKDLNDMEVGLDEEFKPGLRYPRDTSSNDPSEVINCRCTVLIVPSEGA